MIEPQNDINQTAVDFFKSAILGQSGETQAAYGRVIKSFYTFLSAHGLIISDLSEAMVTDWAIELLRNGLSPKNVRKYTDILASLVNSATKAGIITGADQVRKARARIGEWCKADPCVEPAAEEEFVRRFTALMRANPETLAGSGNVKSRVWRDVILLSLLNGGMDLVEAARLTKDDQTGRNEETAAVIERNQSPQRRKYVFDLDQSAMTPRQFAAEVRKRTLQLLHDRVSPAIADPQQAVRSMWVETVMRGGATASTALGCQPEGLKCLTLPPIAGRTEVGHALKEELMNTVASTIVNNPQRWYAMHMRRRVTPEDIDRQIEDEAAPWKPAATFYPLAEITKRIKGKRVTLQKPYITDVLFFKSRVTDILPLFRRIGDKAWCYRTTNAPGAPYATIPQSEMSRFQAAIGEFTPDTELYPLDAAPLAPGDEVVVLGGLLAGSCGKVSKPVKDRKTGRTLYKVILQQMGKDGRPEGYEWLSARVEAHLDPRQLKSTHTN